MPESDGWVQEARRGELDPNVDPEVALDLIFGAAMYRMATEHGGLTPADADAIAATAMRALARGAGLRYRCASA